MYPTIGGAPYGVYGGGIRYAAYDPYGSLNLTVTSPAQSFAEPLSLVEVRDYLKLPVRTPTDQDEDSTIQGLISAARAMAEPLQNRDLVVKQWDLSYDYWPSCRVRLRPPLIGVDLVQYKDSNGDTHALVENTDYIVDAAKQPAVLAPVYNTTWPTFTPWPSSAVLIRFRAGLASTDPFWSGPGARVKVGMKRLISDWFNNRLPFDAKAEDLPYGVSVCLSWGAVPRVK